MPGSLMMGRRAQGLDTSIDELMKQIEALSPEPDGEARTSPQGRPAAVRRVALDAVSEFLASARDVKRSAAHAEETASMPGIPLSSGGARFSIRDVQIGSYRISAKPVGSGGHLIVR